MLLGISIKNGKIELIISTSFFDLVHEDRVKGLTHEAYHIVDHTISRTLRWHEENTVSFMPEKSEEEYRDTIATIFNWASDAYINSIHMPTRLYKLGDINTITDVTFRERYDGWDIQKHTIEETVMLLVKKGLRYSEDSSGKRVYYNQVKDTAPYDDAFDVLRSKLLLSKTVDEQFVGYLFLQADVTYVEETEEDSAKYSFSDSGEEFDVIIPGEGGEDGEEGGLSAEAVEAQINHIVESAAKAAGATSSKLYRVYENTKYHKLIPFSSFVRKGLNGLVRRRRVEAPRRINRKRGFGIGRRRSVGPSVLLMYDESGSVGDDELLVVKGEIRGAMKTSDVYVTSYAHGWSGKIEHMRHWTGRTTRNEYGGTSIDTALTKAADTIRGKFDYVIIITDGYDSSKIDARQLLGSAVRGLVVSFGPPLLINGFSHMEVDINGKKS